MNVHPIGQFSFGGKLVNVLEEARVSPVHEENHPLMTSLVVVSAQVHLRIGAIQPQ